MKKTIILLSLCALFIGCAREYGGVPETKNYPVSGSYTGLDVSSAFQVTVSDEVTDVVVTVGELAHDRVIVKIIDGTLYIGFKPYTRYNGTATAVIPANANLCELDLSGASSFTGDLHGHEVDIDLSGASTFEGTLNGHEMDIDLSGASHFNRVLVNADEIDLDLSGASKASLHGVCQNKMKIDLSGASKLDASLLETPSVHGEMSGASRADVTVCSGLSVNLSSASTLTYGTVSGDCNPVINCSTSGGSTVRARR